MAKGSNSLSKTAVWILLGLLILGLGGFGATNLSGTIRTIGKVGDKHIDVDDYARQLAQEIRAVEAETGQSLPFAQVQAIGLDQAVLQRLVATRALDHEATELGLSIGDETLRNQILDIPAFRGIDGNFDRDGYAFTLEQTGLSEAEFENRLREEASRTLLQGAIVSGVVMPDTYARTLVDYVGEGRDFTMARLTETDLDALLAPATESELRAFHSANQNEFNRPAIKVITYALLTPDMLLDSVEIDEDALRAEYDARRGEFNQPERRLVERLPFLDQDAADQAAAALEVSGTTFEALVDERGLELSDVDLGDVGRLELDAAGEAVFGAEVGDVVGPLPSSLGPSLYRVNGILPALQVSFEQAEPRLRETLAADRARRMVDRQAQDLDDLLAGGATLEELATESDMQIGTVDWHINSAADINAYTGFRDAAAAVTAEDFPQIENLSDGGLFALRLDDEQPQRPATFEESGDDVRARFETRRLGDALRKKAETLVPQIDGGASLADLGLSPSQETGQLRSSFINSTPPDFMQQIFEMSPGDVRIVDAFGSVIIVQLDAINPATDNPDAATLQGQLSAQANQSLSQNIFDLYSADTTLRAGPQVDPRAVQAVHVNFP